MIKGSTHFPEQVIKYVGKNSEGGKCRTVTIQLTSSCNLQCDYCYECHKTNEEMTVETADKVCDFLLAEIDKQEGFMGREVEKGLVIDFIGGDPMLRCDLMEHIIKKLTLGIYKVRPDLLPYTYFNISTNGVNFFEPVVQNFMKHWGKMISCSVSIDGVKELHDAHRKDANGNGSFDKAMKAFKYCQKEYGSSNTKMTFVAESFKYVKDSIIMMAKEGVDSIRCNCAYEPEYTYEQATELFNQLRETADWLIENKCNSLVPIMDDFGLGVPRMTEKNFCGGTGEMLAFDVHGDAYPCIRFCPVCVGKDLAKGAKIGDVEGLLQTQEQKDFYDNLMNITYESQSPQKCLDCPISGGCGWCSGWNYQMGDVNKRWTGICTTHQARVLARVYYHNKRYLELGDVEPCKNLVPLEWQMNILTQEQKEEIDRLEKEAFEKLEAR